ncbi:hypothetical protein AHAS_Ahas20G0044500 [Arachis hypogaea]
MVGVPPLKWDVKLKKKAQELVNEYLEICWGKPPPSKSPIYGENLMWKYASAEHVTAAKAPHSSGEIRNRFMCVKGETKIGKKLEKSPVSEEELIKKIEELAQEEANNLSSMVHSDNVRLEHDVAFLKAVLDDTQKELHSTRGVIAGERARAFQLQISKEEISLLKRKPSSLSCMLLLATVTKVAVGNM